MKLKKYLNINSFSPKAPGQKTLILFGAIFILILLFSYYYDYRLESKYRPKIEALENLKIELSIVHLKFEDELGRKIEDENLKSFFKLENLKEVFSKKLKAKAWDDFLFFNLSKKDLQNIDSVLETVKGFEEKLKTPKTLNTSDLHDKIFVVILDKIEEVKDAILYKIILKDKFSHNLQLLVFFLGVIYLVLGGVMIKKNADKKQLLLSKIKILVDELKNKNLLLVKNKNDLNKAQKIAKIGSYNLNLETNTGYCSNSFFNIGGFEKDDEKKLSTWWDIVHPEDLAKNKKVLKESVKTGKKIDFTYRILTKDTKELKWIHNVAELVFNEGKPTHLVGVIQDITERKLIEDKLLISNKRNKEAQKIGKLGYIDWNLITNDLVLSEELLRMFDFDDDKEKFKLEDLIKGIHPEDVDFVSKSLQNAITNIEPYNIEHRIIKTDGSFIYVHAQAKLLKNKNNKPVRLYGTVLDITERKNLELSLKANQKQLVDSHKITHLGTFIFDDKTKLFESSAILDEIMGIDSQYTKDQIGFINLIHHDDKSKIYNLLNDNAVESIKEEFKIINYKNQKIVWVLGFAKKVFDNKRNRIKVVGTLQNITERKLAEEKINLLNEALNQSSESVMITNLKGIFKYVNPAFSKLTGYSQLDVMGKTPRILKSGMQNSNIYKNLWKTINAGLVWEGELVNKRKDGTLFLSSLSITPVNSKMGKLKYFIGFEKNITDSRKLEQSFIQDFVVSHEQEKQSFSENLHDVISQTLMAESIYIDALLKINQDSKNINNKYLQKIKTFNTKAVNDILSMAYGFMTKYLKENGLLKSIENLCIDNNNTSVVSFNFLNKKVTENLISDDLKTILFRIARELTENIIKHSNATKAEFEISLSKKNCLKLMVKDNGIGFDHNKIKNENIGLGLNNIERRVQLLNGKMSVKTAINEGSEFIILLPLDETVKLRRGN